MENELLTSEVPSIKDQLVARFLVARDAVGRNWRKVLSEADPYFNTKVGVDDMTLTAQAIHEGRRRGQVDKIKRVVMGLEKLAGIPHAPIL